MPRVLIVDDSATARELLTEILDADPEIEVVGTAKNGREALSLTQELKPDIITMDIHMPVMDGFQSTKEIMIESPTPIVLVSASTSVTEVEWAINALEAGALTLKLKPPGPNNPHFEAIARDLVETVKTMSEVRVLRHHRRLQSPRSEVRPRIALPNKSNGTIRAVAIAASTGGPPALGKLLAEIPENFPVPILLVQHIAVGFVEGFAAWLNSTVPLMAKVADEGEHLEPGTIYIGPDERHLGASLGMRVELSEDPPIGGFRPSANHLFQSLSDVLHSDVLGIVLTGMGRDGSDGLRTLHSRGGRTIVQDEATSVVFGMPAAAIAAGAADAVLPLDQIAEHILDWVGC